MDRLPETRLTTSAVSAAGLSKCYHLYERPLHRLLQLAFGERRRYYREFWALRDASFELAPGEVLGIVGRNGAGKSTLLQLVCGTLAPTGGTIDVNGRVAALLELGAGFNPEFTGRENVHLAASILGLTRAEVAARFDEIVEFSGIGEFIDQPVKFYSSGMYVRLAFAVATSVDPDVLVIDEALSVGDGEFARKSFDRIMTLKEAGKTILFCSHSLYHIEAICTRALWLKDGHIEMLDAPSRVIAAYSAFMDTGRAQASTGVSTGAPAGEVRPATSQSARITGIEVSVDGVIGTKHVLRSGKSTLRITVRYGSDPSRPGPSLGVGVVHSSGLLVSSAGSVNDGVTFSRDLAGNGVATLVFPACALLKGEYTLNLLLFCERGLHVYDYSVNYGLLEVTQQGLEQGFVSLPHQWQHD
jgi:lipopolysaccharide transport system ATP-binding protein